MSKVFRRKIFSNYLGEQRALCDIITQFISNPLPPSPTPTPSLTPTLTVTPSITPTATPNPLCPQQLIITESNNTFYVDGVYNRLTTYTGGTFTSAYSDGGFQRVILGTAPNGRDYATYVFQSGTTYYQFIKRYDNERWGVITTTGDTWLNGGTFITQLFNAPNTDLFDGSIYYPTTGLQTGAISYYLSYPSSCPTPTPTPTISLTPSLTPTKTPTPTPTITPSAEFFIYDAQDCNDPFAAPVVVKSTSFLVIGSSVKVIGDSNTCYEILNTGFPPEDFIVDTTYTDCIDCNSTLITPTPTNTPTLTPTKTPTPTPSLTPTKTPTPTPSLITYYYYEAVSCNNLFGPTSILRHTSQLFIGDVVSVFGDPINCYEIIGLDSGPSFMFDVNSAYGDCGSCIPGP